MLNFKKDVIELAGLWTPQEIIENYCSSYFWDNVCFKSLNKRLLNIIND